jgi:hypothetical protein
METLRSRCGLVVSREPCSPNYLLGRLKRQRQSRARNGRKACGPPGPPGAQPFSTWNWLRPDHLVLGSRGRRSLTAIMAREPARGLATGVGPNIPLLGDERTGWTWFASRARSGAARAH